MNLVLAIVIAVIGGYLGERVGIPQGALLGSLLAVAAVNIAGVVDVPNLPRPLLFAMYILIGVELGSQVNRSTVAQLGQAWLPGVLFIAALIVATVAAAFLISRVFGLDFTTWIFSTAPGAFSGMAALGAGVGANVPVVVAVHALRVTVIVFAVPFIHRILVR